MLAKTGRRRSGQQRHLIHVRVTSAFPDSDRIVDITDGGDVCRGGRRRNQVVDRREPRGVNRRRPANGQARQ